MSYESDAAEIDQTYWDMVSIDNCGTITWLFAADEIVDAYGLASQAELRRIVSPRHWPGECPGCGGTLVATTRAALSTFSRVVGARRRSSGPWPCRTCREREQAETRRRWDALDEQRRSWKERLAVLAAMPYSEYLRTPEWQERRRKALKQAYYRCQLCNGNDMLNVHHRTYERRGSEWNADLIVLCRSCHAHHHRLAG